MIKAKIHLVQKFARVRQTDNTIEITQQLSNKLTELQKKQLKRAKKHGYFVQYVID